MMVAMGNLNQKELAEALGVTTGAVSQWNKGRSKIDLEHLVTVSKLSGTSLHWLAFGEGPQKLDSKVEDKRISLEEVFDQKIEEIVERKLRRMIMEIQFESLVPTDVPIVRIPVPILDAVAGGAADEPFRIKSSDDDTSSSDRRSERRKTG